MNQAVRSVMLMLPILVSAEQACALDTYLSPFYISAKIGVSSMTAGNITNTSRLAAGQTAATLTKKDSHDIVMPFGAAIGYNWGIHGVALRTEFEYLNRANFEYNSSPMFTDSGLPIGLTSRIVSQTMFANTYYDFVNKTPFTPFVGGGIGAAINKSTTNLTIIGSGNIDKFTNSSTKFAWNVGAGIAFNLTEIMLLEVSYRYTDLGGAIWGSKSAVELTTHTLYANEFLFGARYQF
jgi:outer membrane immunogenic protein